MPEQRLKYVHRVTSRSGKTRHYLRIRRVGYPIRGEPGSAEYLENYRALLALHQTGERNVRSGSRVGGAQRPKWLPGSVGSVVGKYLKSNQHAALADGTRKAYRRALEAIRGNIGHRVLVRLDCDDIDFYCTQIANEKGAASADLHRHLISTLWKFSKGLRECRRKGRSNPTTSANKHYKVKSPHKPWPVSVQRTFLQAANPTLKLAFHLLLYTGQRRADVVAMKWCDFDGKKIHIAQQKTAETVSIHLHRRLRELLQATPRIGEHVLTNRWGKPCTPGALTTAVKRTLKEICAPNYTLHGLRKSAAVTLAELGCSELEIMAVLGHKTSKMALHYCREANKAKLNERAIRAWEGSDQL
jgi:integrase